MRGILSSCASLFTEATTEKMGTKVTDAMLFRFFAGQTSNEETDLISSWLNENPAEHQKIFNKANELYLLSIMCESDTAIDNRRGMVHRIGWSKIIRYAGGIAAALLIGFGTNHFFSSKRINEWAGQMTTIEAPAGQHIRVTLNDGSVIDLNSGARMVYPSIFTGKERRIKLQGEAMFDVEHDPEHPFVVETFACEVTVLGTRFNVIAEQAENLFSTALLRGRVSVTNTLNGEQILMAENTEVQLENGLLQLNETINPDEYLWPDGIISVSGIPFDQVVAKLEKCYNVKITLKRATPPAINYQRCKIRISDGIDHAMQILQSASDFTYTYDETDNSILIK